MRFLFVFCCCWMLSFGNGVLGKTSNSQINKEYVEKLLEKSSTYLKSSHKDVKEKGIKLLNFLEVLVKDQQDAYLKLKVNSAKIDFFLNNRDTIYAKQYIDKNFELIDRIKDERELGLNYEVLGVLMSLQGKKEAAKTAYIKAKDKLSEFGKPADRIDINYNLAIILLREEAWKASREHALASLKAIKETGVKKDRVKRLQMMLATSHIYLGEYVAAQASFDSILQDAYYKPDQYNFEGLFSHTKGIYFEEKNELKKAAFHYRESSKHYKKYAYEKMNEISSSIALENKLRLQEKENDKIRVENELNKERLKSTKYLFILCMIVIAILIVFGANQFKAVRYKTKVNQQLTKNYEDLVLANKKVDLAYQAKSDFMDAITHELLTPLNTIKGISFLLQKRKKNTEEEHQMKLINLSSDYLLEMINDVIHLNALNNGGEEIKREPFNLNFLIKDLVASSLVTKNNKNNKIHCTLDDKIPEVLSGDMLKVSRVVTHLLDNALKFTKEGDVYVSTSLLHSGKETVDVRFVIKDTGRGMSDKERQQIFDIFNQGSVKVNREYGGVGLGLSIVKKILTLLEGEATVESSLGKGATFSFDLSFGRVVTQDKPQEKALKNSWSEDKSRLNVLLVEDNKVNQLITEKIITNYGFKCDSANDGEEAVALTREKEYSLVLMDVMMPKMDGFEATKHIKGMYKKLPVIALTALSEDLNKEKFDEAGIDEVLSKPVNPEKLYQTIVRYSKPMS